MKGMDRLLELQDLDTSIDRLEARRAALESGEEVRAVRERATAAENLVGELRLAIDSVGREQRRLEHDIETLELKQADEEKRMYGGSIVNQKELDAVQHEIANIKGRRSSFEDELLERMEKREELEARLRVGEADMETARGQAEEAASASQKELGDVGSELAERRAAREALSPEFDPELLELYEDLRASKKGIGVAALVDGTCQGCHQTLSSVELNKVKHAEGVARCEYCRRILIV